MTDANDDLVEAAELEARCTCPGFKPPDHARRSFDVDIYACEVCGHLGGDHEPAGCRGDR